MSAIKFYSFHIWKTAPKISTNFLYRNIDCYASIDPQSQTFELVYDDYKACPGFEREITKPEKYDIFAMIKHEWTGKDPLHYLQSFRIDKNTETGKHLIAKHVEMRIRGGA